jgi:4-amino-4-deoxy-L-arabinose transferase-like glycosyltransferase
VDKRILLLIAGCAAFVIWYLLILNGVYSISSDETSRTLISYYWYKSGTIGSSSWLPLHFMIIGGGFALITEMIWMPRIISLVFGIMSIAVVMLLAEELFKRKEVMLYAVIIILLLPQRVILSLVPLPEIIFIFTVLAASLAFLKYLKYGRQSLLIYTALFMTAANALRYEGWIISASIGVYILFNHNSFKKAVPALIILSSFPLFWVVFDYMRFGELFYFFNEPQRYYAFTEKQNNGNVFTYNPLFQFVEQNLITLNIAGLIALYHLRKNIQLRKWFIILFIPLIIFSAASLSGKSLPAHNYWRTSAVWALLLVPFTSYLIYKMRSLLSLKEFAALTTGFMIAIAGANYFYMDKIGDEYTLTENKIATAEKIMDYMESTDKSERVLIEDINTFEHFDITLASGEPYRFIYSLRNQLTPVNAEKYSGTVINYYLVKSRELKEKLRNKGEYRIVLEQHGWELFKRLSDAASN